MEIDLTGKIQSSVRQTLLYSIVFWRSFLGGQMILYKVNVKRRTSKCVFAEIADSTLIPNVQIYTKLYGKQAESRCMLSKVFTCFLLPFVLFHPILLHTFVFCTRLWNWVVSPVAHSAKGLFNIWYAPSIPVPPIRPWPVWKASINKKFEMIHFSVLSTQSVLTNSKPFRPSSGLILKFMIISFSSRQEEGWKASLYIYDLLLSAWNLQQSRCRGFAASHAEWDKSEHFSIMASFRSTFSCF